jgi:magnesium and cobalt transporter
VRDSGRTRLPLTRGGRPIGLVHAKDLLVARDREQPLERLARPLTHVAAGTGLADVLELLRDRQAQLAVVDGADAAAPGGIIALEDVLEQIVGPIEDEFDRRDSAAGG